MSRVLNSLQGTLLVSKVVAQDPSKLLCRKFSPYVAKYDDRYHSVLLSSQGIRLILHYFETLNLRPVLRQVCLILKLCLSTKSGGSLL